MSFLMVHALVSVKRTFKIKNYADDKAIIYPLFSELN